MSCSFVHWNSINLSPTVEGKTNLQVPREGTAHEQTYLGNRNTNGCFRGKLNAIFFFLRLSFLCPRQGVERICQAPIKRTAHTNLAWSSALCSPSQEERASPESKCCCPSIIDFPLVQLATTCFPAAGRTMMLPMSWFVKPIGFPVLTWPGSSCPGHHCLISPFLGSGCGSTVLEGAQTQRAHSEESTWWADSEIRVVRNRWRCCNQLTRGGSWSYQSLQMPKGLKSCPEEEGLNLSCMTSQERIRVEEGAR